MATFFSQIQHTFAPTSEDSSEDVDAATFLAATRESLALLDKLGFAFRLVKADILGNVSRLESVQHTDAVKYATFRAILANDIENGEFDDAYSAASALLWLKRALEFFCAFTALLVSEYRSGSLDDSLLNVVYLAYDESLKRHHNWLMRGTFYFVARAMPSRRNFFKALANGQESMDEKIIEDMDQFVKLLASNLASVNQIFTDLGRPD